MLNLLEMAANICIYLVCSYLILSGIEIFLIPRWRHPAANIPIMIVLIQAVASVVYPEELTGLTRVCSSLQQHSFYFSEANGI